MYTCVLCFSEGLLLKKKEEEEVEVEERALGVASTARWPQKKNGERRRR